MGNKNAKKLRRVMRQEVRENFGDGIEALSKIIRTRPRFIPKPIWILTFLPLFKFKHLRFVYKHLK